MCSERICVQESFNDGLAFSALINAFDKDFLEYDSLDKKDKENNLTNAFAVAESKMGIPTLLDAEDLLEGHPDER